MNKLSLLLHQQVNRVRVARAAAFTALLLVLCGSAAIAQPLAGTYTVGGGAPNYTTIEAAIADLNARGVSAPVTFAIRTGTYTPPATGYVLSNVATMTSTNTVTFRPDANAIVTVDGSLTVPIFDLNGAKYYIIDGWGGAGVQKRDWKIIQRSSSQVIRFINGAQYNVVRNTNLMSNSSTTTAGHIAFSTTGTVGNSYNTITKNTIGDSTATLRSSTGIYMAGTTNLRNSRNLIDDNDIINLGYTGGWIYGFYYSSNNDSTVFTHNRIRVTNTLNSSSVYPLYGVYFTNSSSSGDTIAYNQIWDLKSLYNSATTYGMYFSTAGTNVIAIHNNMIALSGDAQTSAGVHGIYIPLSNTTNFTVDNNSIDITGTLTSTSTNYGIYMSTTNVTLRNNAISMSRPSTGATTGYPIYRSSATGTLTSNYNVVNFSGVGPTFGYYAGTAYASLSSWQVGTGKDANSRQGNPRFINPAVGDLHISTLVRTPVEGAGTPIVGITTDIDGNGRNGVTPDVGADEGAFQALLSNDMAADKFLSPAPVSVRPSNTVFSPTAQVVNAGALTQTNVNVRYRILNASNTAVYSDVQTVASISSGSTVALTFNTIGNLLGTTSQPAGTYTIELTTQLAGDQDATNDMITSTLTLKDQLNGTYTINKVGSGPRNYTSFTEAIADLNFIGVNAPVIFEIANGTYDNSTETFPLTLNAAPGVSATNSVRFRPAAGANPVLTGTSPVSSAIIMINGGKYFTLDGSNVVGGTTRNWTIRNTEPTTSPTIWMRNDADLNTVKNCIVMGSSSTCTKTSSSTGIGVVFIGVTTAATGNDSNLIQNCTIGDPSGVFRSNIGVGCYGTSAKPNSGNRIDGCDILNFGNANTYGYGVVAYAEQAGTVVNNCDIHNTVSAPAGITTMYGIYTDYSPGYPINSVFNGNRIYKLTSLASNWTVYGIYHWVSTSTANSTITNNFISLAETGDHTYYGIYFTTSTGTINLFHNTIYFGGASTGTRTQYMLYKSSSSAINSRNNVFYSNRVAGSSTLYGLYISSTTTWVSNNNLINVNNGSTAYTGYYGGARLTLALFQSASSQDGASTNGPVTLLDPINGNPHINPQPVFAGESRAVTGLGVTTDIDAQTRDGSYPDLGADEGDFNGGGIQVVSPNGGEKYSVSYLMDVQFTLNRPLPVRIDFSTNSGATWTSMGTTNGVIGTNTFTITTPSTVTTTARVRVVSTKNQWEADTSDANFELVLPVFTITMPNGGESVVPTDTLALSWNSQFAPPAMRLQLEYSTDAGTSWNLINNNIYTQNLPATNSYPWIVPNSPTSQARVRIKVFGGAINDVSDNNFTIQQQPSVILANPMGGEQWVRGEVDSVKWTSVNTQSVLLQYSTDGGTSWLDVVPGGPTLPAYLPGYPWTIPNTPSADVCVKITNAERPRFNYTRCGLSILSPSVQVFTPNGGEEYNLNQPITVNWTSVSTTKFVLLYSTDKGTTWTEVARDIPAAAGTFQFTPTPIPTRLAMVRLANQDHMTIFDQSDAPFSVRDAKSIVVYTPGAGDQFARNSNTVITWDAPEVNYVNLLYSLNGGSNWTVIANNVPAADGSRGWTVPNQLTSTGKIRVQDAASSSYGESGIFSIVDQVQLAVHVTAPDGGEKYTQGDMVNITWSSTGLDKVNIYYVKGTGGLQPIASAVPAVPGTYKWMVNIPPGTDYKIVVRAALGGTPSDESDETFEVQSKQQPRILVLYPDGGERLTVDSIVQIRWSATDITGNVKIEWSPTAGAGNRWDSLASVPASDGVWAWKIPDSVTTMALVRVSKPGLNIRDTSNAVFEITRKVVPQWRLLTPNGGENWGTGSKQMITWEVVPGYDSLSIEYSTDNGGNWNLITASAPFQPGQYEWTVPPLSSGTTTALVRIKDVRSNQGDISDASFSISQIAGVGGAVAGASGLKLMGNYPNPFTAQTELRWQQGVAGDVEVRVYSTNGNLVRAAQLGRREAGEQRLVIDGNDLGSGIYMYEVRLAQQIARGLMTIVR